MAVDLSAEELAELGEELGGGSRTAVCDVADTEAFGTFLMRIEDELGVIDVCFANAGIAVGTDPLATRAEIWVMLSVTNPARLGSVCEALTLDPVGAPVVLDQPLLG